jgi:hypothetical protein
MDVTVDVPAPLTDAEKAQTLQRVDQLLTVFKISECEQAARIIDDALKRAPEDRELKAKKAVIDATLKHLRGGGGR